MEANSDAQTGRIKSNRARKMSQADIIFKCECGRAYLTFSALYLHAKNKHNVRFTIKKHHHKCIVQQQTGRKNITYYLHTQPHYIETEPKQKSRIDQSQLDFKTQLESFESQTNEIEEKGDIYKLQKSDVVHNLQAYFGQIVDISATNVELSTDLPLYFNDYLVQFRNRRDQKQRSVDAHVEIEILIQLWKWLKEKGLTKVDIKLNEQFKV